MAVDYSAKREFEQNEQWRATYPEKVLPQEKIDHMTNRERNRTTELRKALFSSVLAIVISLFIDFGLGKYLHFVAGPAQQNINNALQIAGAVIILGATLNEIGWKIQSWSGESFPEIINRQICKISYIIGTFLFIIPVGW